MGPLNPMSLVLNSEIGAASGRSLPQPEDDTQTTEKFTNLAGVQNPKLTTFYEPGTDAWSDCKSERFNPSAC